MGEVFLGRCHTLGECHSAGVVQFVAHRDGDQQQCHEHEQLGINLVQRVLME